MTKKRAVILSSGGLDSTTVLAMAQQQGYECYCLSFDYGQRHSAELDASVKIADVMGAKEHRIAKLDLSCFGGSALTDMDIAVPEDEEDMGNIPITYVPARNTVFLSYALAWAEVLEASEIFIGVNAVDYSGYPDCRPDFIAAFESLANLATRSGVEGLKLSIQAPLMKMSKAQIIKRGLELGVDYSLTVSCYQADDKGLACGRCESCRLRKQGFVEAKTADTTRYQPV
ncbi:MAG: 7-cyano-7-deazaguanine synthase QueC [Pseudomonadales bacterium]|nr:7-cyano-7-deazaguanine synthase QueC [Pseudomonadales bacterium]